MCIRDRAKVVSLVLAVRSEALKKVKMPSQPSRMSLARSKLCAETRYDRIHAQDKVYHPRSILIDLGSWREAGRQGGFGLAVGALHSGQLGMAQRLSLIHI